MLFFLGTLLISASVLKGLVLWRGEVSGAIAWFPEGTREFVVIAEAFLGVWWVSGFAETMARRIAFVVFLLFAGIACLMVWRGVGSCGCFGSLRTNPLELLLFDLAILGLLYGLSSRETLKERFVSSIGMVETVCRVTAAGCMAAGVVLLVDGNRPPLLQLGSDDVPKAVGKRLEDLGKIDIAEKLEHAPKPGCYAVSLNAVRGHPLKNMRKTNMGSQSGGFPVPDDATYFQYLRPVDHAGYSIMIYHITPRTLRELEAAMLGGSTARFPGGSLMERKDQITGDDQGLFVRDDADIRRFPVLQPPMGGKSQ